MSAEAKERGYGGDPDEVAKARDRAERARRDRIKRQRDQWRAGGADKSGRSAAVECA
jgi:hypothetical protein